ncbi:MAG: hypothetical protein AAF479_08500 [Pseudomonadota bacterium]
MLSMLAYSMVSYWIAIANIEPAYSDSYYTSVDTALLLSVAAVVALALIVSFGCLALAKQLDRRDGGVS